MAETGTVVSYVLTQEAVDAGITGLELKFAGGIAQGPMLDVIGAMELQGEGGRLTVVDNALKEALDSTPYLMRVGSIESIVTVLPAASPIYRGDVLLLDGAGVHRDIQYVCVEKPGGTYEWERIPVVLFWTIGDGSTTSFTITHQLNNQFPHVTVTNLSTQQAEGVDLTDIDADNFTVDFGAGNAPPTNGYKVMVIG